MGRAILLLAVLAMAACPGPQPGPVPPDVVVALPDGSPARIDAPDPVSDASPDAIDAAPTLDAVACPDLCCASCARLAQLKCPEAERTPHGLSCAEVCRMVQVFHGLDLKRETIVSCQTVACVRRAGVACGP
jgi:hypothetical protein